MHDPLRQLEEAGLSLLVMDGAEEVFRDAQEGLRPLLRFIDELGTAQPQWRFYDRTVGRAALLLFALIEARHVETLLLSDTARQAAAQHGVDVRGRSSTPVILRADGGAMCPMEELASGKAPGEFLEAFRERLGRRAH